jgi:hypothetical protein
MESNIIQTPHKKKHHLEESEMTGGGSITVAFAISECRSGSNPLLSLCLDRCRASPLATSQWQGLGSFQRLMQRESFVQNHLFSYSIFAKCLVTNRKRVSISSIGAGFAGSYLIDISSSARNSQTRRIHPIFISLTKVRRAFSHMREPSVVWIVACRKPRKSRFGDSFAPRALSCRFNHWQTTLVFGLTNDSSIIGSDCGETDTMAAIDVTPIGTVMPRWQSQCLIRRSVRLPIRFVVSGRTDFGTPRCVR